MKRLLSNLGAVVVQAMTGTKDQAEVESWETDGVPESARAQIALADRVLDIMLPAEGPNVTFAWMVGANSRLGDTTPVTAIRELNYDVIGAALAFTHDAGYS